MPAISEPRRNTAGMARALLPVLSLALVVAAIAGLNPRAISYFGFNLMLNLAVPIALATVAQMFVIAGNDLDLSIGPFIGFVGCVAATWLHDDTVGWRCRARGLRRSVRRIGRADPVARFAVHRGHPGHELRLAGTRDPRIAEARRRRAGLAAIAGEPQAAAGAAADPCRPGDCRHRLVRADAHLVWRDPARLGWKSRRHSPRGLVPAEDQDGAVRAGGPVRRAVGNDPDRPHHLGRRQRSATGYTLLSIAGVILGGGEFVGGKVSPVGAVLGALTLALAASPLLTFMQIPPDWQVGANGAILIIVLAARALLGRKASRA